MLLLAGDEVNKIFYLDGKQRWIVHKGSLGRKEKMWGIQPSDLSVGRTLLSVQSLGQPHI